MNMAQPYADKDPFSLGQSGESMPLQALPDVIPVSENLYLRRTLPDDDAALFAMLQRNPDIPTHVAWAKDIRTIEEVIPSLQRLSNIHMDGRYVIITNNQVSGAIWTFPGGNDEDFGIGYCLDQSARGRGYVTKAATALLEQLKVLGAHQAYFQVMLTNTGSTAVAQRLGCQPAEVVMGKDFPVQQQRWRLKLI